MDITPNTNRELGATIDLQIDFIREASRRLITTVALVTTVGRHGANVMAAEWVFQVSYQPMRFIVLVYSGDATQVELTVKFNDIPVVNTTADSDDQGYFTLRHQFDHEPQKGQYEATAAWKELKGKAYQTV